MRYAITRASIEADFSPPRTAPVLSLFDDARGSEKLAQRLIRLAAGAELERHEPAADELCYLLEGDAAAALEGRRVELGPGTGLFVACGEAWALETRSGGELVSVLVAAPPPAAARHAVVELAGAARRAATAAREFTLGVGPAVGCLSATQFLGHVPPGRAPDHFHRYDEVIYVLAGSGVLHVGGEEAPLAPGACVHLPAGLVHCLENTGGGELTLLGVFTPAGSPAEAYYPDGTPAATPKED
jgi:mannose-6-phosphate isomerase-like protein (cupin superfamily)